MFVDSHCHLDAAEFDVDRPQVLARARAAGVLTQVVPAVAASGWGALKALCEGDPGLHPAYGLHPMYLDQHRPADLDALGAWLQGERACAVGELGLDFHVEGLDADEQRRYFIGQLELARALDLPVILHARRALEEVTLALRRIGGLRGVVHSFSGSAEQAAQLWSLGFHLGIGGPVTYERAARLRGIVATMPLQWLLLETDAPDQPLASLRGQRNEPCHLPEVARTIAGLRGIPLEQVADATSANARDLFGITRP